MPRNPVNMIIQENHAADEAYFYYIILWDFLSEKKVPAKETS